MAKHDNRRMNIVFIQHVIACNKPAYRFDN